MITTVLWDIDGTLLDFQKAEKYALKKCFEIFGIGECTDEMIKRYSAVNRNYWESLERGEISKSRVLRGRFEDFFRLEGIVFDKIDDFNGEYQLRLGDKIFFCDNGLETVTSLKGKVRQYAVTNGTLLAQSRKLKLSGLGDIFDGIFISDEVGFEKPAGEFFDFVKNSIGGFPPNAVMIVGDSLTSDIMGGNNAGIICCWYNPHGIVNKSNAKIHYEIKDISEVREIIKKSARQE